MTDGLNSVSVALDALGNVSGQVLYFPYGGARYVTGRFPTTHGFTGQDEDGNTTGLYYDHARYYDPTIGQFAQADPTSGSGLNAFAYVGGNPETATDPSGTVRCIDDCGGLAVSRYTAQQWTQIFYQDAASSSSAAAALYLWSHKEWLQAENYAENVKHTSLMYQTGMGAVAYMNPRVGQNWGAGGVAEMEEFGLLQTARAWAVEGATGSMYDGPHAMSMMHTATGMGGMLPSGVVGEGTGWADAALSSPLASEGEGDSGLSAIGGCGESFAPSTPVATPDPDQGSHGHSDGDGDSGGARAISSLRVGDRVEAYDPTTHTTSVQTVQQVFIDHDTDLLDVTLRTLRTATSTHHALTHDEVVHTTASHPWLTADHGWERAGVLRVGESVVTASGGTAAVVALHVVAGAADMWDLTVSNVHTFVVGSGAYVVHNCAAPSEWADPNTLTSHFNRHGGDFGAQSADEYVRMSQEFRREGIDPSSSALRKFDPTDGSYRIYNPDTDTLGVYNASDQTISYYKPDPIANGYSTNMDYWNDVQGTPF